VSDGGVTCVPSETVVEAPARLTGRP